MKAEKHINRIRYILLLVSFLPVICFPVFNQMHPLIHKKQINQVYLKTPLPRFDVKRLDKFPKQFEDYFNDTLQLRDKLVLVNSLFKIKILNASYLNSKVIIGNHGWLYMRSVPYEYYSDMRPYTKNRFDSLRTILKRRAQWAKEKGMKFYCVIAPNKPFIYPGYLPSEFRNDKKPDRTDKIIDYMKQDTDVAIIDLREVLLKHKSPIPLYFKTDNHWNDLGAYYAYTEIINRLRKDFPAIGEPMKLNNFRIDSSEKRAGGESIYLNMEEWYYDRKIKLIPLYKEKAKDGKKMNYPCVDGFPIPWDYEVDKETGNDSLPSIVVIRDSFTDFLIPFLQEHFKRSVYIFDAWRYKENRKIIENEKPNIVMLLVLDNGIEGIIMCDPIPEE